MLKKYHTLAYIMEINRILPLLSTAMVDIENGAGKVSEEEGAVVLVKRIKETNFVGRIKYYSELFYGQMHIKASFPVTQEQRKVDFPVSILCEAIGILLEIGCKRINCKPNSYNNKEAMEHAIYLIETVCYVIETLCEDSNDKNSSTPKIGSF